MPCSLRKELICKSISNMSTLCTQYTYYFKHKFSASCIQVARMSCWMDVSERYIPIQNFNAEHRYQRLGLNLVRADTGLFVNSSFNPQNGLQAAAAAHRIGQTR